MSHPQDRTPAQDPNFPMAAAAPIPPFRNPAGASPDSTRLPSLTELFPDKWQPENASSQQNAFYQGARGPRDFPGPPSIAPSPLLSARERGSYTPTQAQAPPSLSPASQHSPALAGRQAPLLPPMQGGEQRGLTGMYPGSQSSTPPQAPREVDPRGYPGGLPPPGPHQQPYYPGMPPREFGPPMPPPPPPPPGYAGAQSSAYPPFDNDYDGKKTGRRRGNLPKQVTDILRMWFQDHVAHPYPTEEEKQQLMHQTGLSISQISNWFINARRRSLPRMTGQGQTDADLNQGHLNH